MYTTNELIRIAIRDINARIALWEAIKTCPNDRIRPSHILDAWAYCDAKADEARNTEDTGDLSRDWEDWEDAAEAIRRFADVLGIMPAAEYP